MENTANLWKLIISDSVLELFKQEEQSYSQEQSYSPKQPWCAACASAAPPAPHRLPHTEVSVQHKTSAVLFLPAASSAHPAPCWRPWCKQTCTWVVPHTKAGLVLQHGQQNSHSALKSELSQQQPVQPVAASRKHVLKLRSPTKQWNLIFVIMFSNYTGTNVFLCQETD